MTKGLSLAIVLSIAMLSVGCTDTCNEACNFASDYIESCMPQWNATWDNFNPEWSAKSDFRKACIDSANEGRGQVSGCCPQEEIDDACEGSSDDDCKENKREECENNALLAIDRNCEDTKEVYRQPCSDYWQSVYEVGGPMLPEENPTCSDPDGEETGDDDDATGE